ncbi:MAG: hypothetical protein Q7R75_02120, partial [bacterium]|nr:hypothetical protein [bacterium]
RVDFKTTGLTTDDNSTPNTIMSLRDDGNVGIGTTGPNAQLDISHASAAEIRLTTDSYEVGETGTLSFGTGATKLGQIQMISNSDNYVDMAFSNWQNNALTEVMRFDAEGGDVEIMNGNVGIGTAAPGVKLHIDNKGLTGLTDTAVYDILKLSNTNAADPQAPKGSNFSIGLSRWVNTGDNYPRTRVDFKTTGLTTDDNSTPNTIMSLRDDGNVGIGTTTPVATLGVNGLMYIGGAGTSTIQNNLYVQGTLRATNSYVGDLIFGNEFRVTEPNASALAFLNPAGENIFQINSNGGMRLGSTATSSLADFQIMGHCVTGDTLLPVRRRKKAKNKRKTGDLESDSDIATNEYDYLLLPITDILPGDEVLSLNESENIFEYRRINALMDMGVQEVFELTTASGRVIRTTAEHPFLTQVIKNSDKN